MTSTILAASWRKGLVAVTGDGVRQELADQSVAALAGDGKGGALAIVGGHSLCQRTADGNWLTRATSELGLSCCVAIGERIYVGTDDARMLRLTARGALEPLSGFGQVAGRGKWYQGVALIDGQMIGPPLGVRSVAVTCDGAAILANVHVGGIPRSTDGGATWQPTIDIDADVHQVCAHPTRANIVIAAAASGLCVSHDAGATWSIENEGLHASYGSAVAFSGDAILIAASTDHFAQQGAVYRRPLDGRGPLQRIGAGLPRWIDGIADTGCVAARDAQIAIADRAGNLYTSQDGGGSWITRAERIPTPSGLLIC